MTRIIRLSSCLLLLSGCCALAHAAALTARIDHVAFHVVDLKVSADFYRDVVGLKAIPEPFNDGRHAWFEIGPKISLHIISGASAVLPKEKRNHLCLSVPALEDFIARLTRNKVAYENLAGEKSAVTRRPDGVNQLYFQDPDGNWLEINDARQ